MNKKRIYLNATFRVSLFSILGFFQFSLVDMGWIYFCENYQDQYSALEALKENGHAVGLTSLLYPALLLMLFKDPAPPSGDGLDGDPALNQPKTKSNKPEVGNGGNVSGGERSP